MNSGVSSCGMPLKLAISLKAPCKRAFCRGAVVADDQIDQRVVEDVHVLQRIDQPSHVVVGVLHERRVDFHLALEHWLELGIHLVPGRDFLVARGQHGVRGNDTQLLLLVESDLALLVPAVGELALVLVDPLLGHVVRRVGRAWREVDEERLVAHQRLLLARPGDGLVRQVLGQVVAFGRRLRWLDRRGAFVEGRVPLIVLAADEAVEVLESAAAGRPRVERARRDSSATLEPHGICRIARSSSH